jgi:hypothetical protein
LRVNYYAIERAVQEILTKDDELANVRVTIEEELLFGAEATPWVGIYLDSREAPANRQRISAGRSTLYLVRLALWCWQYSLESVAKAIELRDDLVGKVEVVLMRHRTLKETVHMSWLEGGELPSARVPERTAWMSGGEIRLVAQVEATTEAA